MSESTGGRPVRILHVIDSLGSLGGAERGFVQEVTRFDRTESAVVVLFDRAPLRDVLVDAGIDVHELRLDAANASRLLPKAARQVSSAIRSFEPDVVHTSLFHADLAGQAAAAFNHLPVVSSMVSSGDLDPNGTDHLRRRTMARLARLASRRSSARYRALTAHAAESHGRALGVAADRTTVIPRGIDLHRFAVLPPAPDAATSGAHFVNVGRHIDAKGQHDLIAAMGIVHAADPTARLSIVGQEGHATGALRREIAALGLDDVVTLATPVDDIRTVLETATAFAFSSHREGLGTAVLEALAQGLSVVAFDIPAVREVTGDGRFASLAPLGDSAAFADRLLHAGSHRPDEATRAQQRAWVEARYDADVVAAQVEDLLISVAGERAGA